MRRERALVIGTAVGFLALVLAFVLGARDPGNSVQTDVPWLADESGNTRVSLGSGRSPSADTPTMDVDSCADIEADAQELAAQEIHGAESRAAVRALIERAKVAGCMTEELEFLDEALSHMPE